MGDLVNVRQRSRGREALRPAPRNLRAMTSTRHIPAEFLNCVLPEIPDWCVFCDLQLKYHTCTVLETAGYADKPAQLAGMTVRELLHVKNLSRDGVCDLVEALHRIAKHRRPDATSKTLDELVLDCLVPVRNSRDRKIAASYFHIGGESLGTLKAIASAVACRPRVFCTFAAGE